MIPYNVVSHYRQKILIQSVACSLNSTWYISKRFVLISPYSRLQSCIAAVVLIRSSIPSKSLAWTEKSNNTKKYHCKDGEPSTKLYETRKMPKEDIAFQTSDKSLSAVGFTRLKHPHNHPTAVFGYNCCSRFWNPLTWDESTHLRRAIDLEQNHQGFSLVRPV